MPSYGYPAVSVGPDSPGLLFILEASRIWGDHHHLDIVLLVVLAALAVWTEVDM